jgi:dolichyl-phosphate-mannose--protein O-mannosyl transferase
MVIAIAPLVVAIVVIAIASLLLRLFNIASIKSLIFDEVYYVDGARDLLAYGVEVDGSAAEFVVHPPIGKWMIASGIKIFGDNPLGWRIATAVAGSLMILLIAAIVYHLFYSPFLTVIASALMAVDGMALVHSRTALLDNFLSLFTLTATYFFIQKSYYLSGLFLGLAIGTKWSGLYFLALFGLIALYRAFTFFNSKDLIKPTLRVVGAFGLTPIAIYIASWSGWFLSDRGWKRDFDSNPLIALKNYHEEILGFHRNLSTAHNYEANPWSWLIQGRPTSFFYETPSGCGADSCSQEVLALGTPLLWWSATIALAVVFGYWIRSIAMRRTDPAATIIIVGIAAGYLPWFFFQDRTVFTFYTIIFQPFMVLALVYCAQLFLSHQRRKSARSYQLGEFGVIALLVLIAINFIYFLPLYMGELIPYQEWINRMWLPSWI